MDHNEASNDKLLDSRLCITKKFHLPTFVIDACRLRKLGIRPRLKQDADKIRFSNVIFSAPPSGSKDYVAEV